MEAYNRGVLKITVILSSFLQIKKKSQLERKKVTLNNYVDKFTWHRRKIKGKKKTVAHFQFVSIHFF